MVLNVKTPMMHVTNFIADTRVHSVSPKRRPSHVERNCCNFKYEFAQELMFNAGIKILSSNVLRIHGLIRE